MGKILCESCNKELVSLSEKQHGDGLEREYWCDCCDISYKEVIDDGVRYIEVIDDYEEDDYDDESEYDWFDIDEDDDDDSDPYSDADWDGE